MTPLGLAWSNLVHKRTRTAIASAGVAFAVALIFMELGMYGGVERTATMLFDGLRFDLLIASSEYGDVGRPGDVHRSRLAQARAADGVREVLPFTVHTGIWRKPDTNGLFGPSPSPGVGSIGFIGVPPDRIPDVFAVDRGRAFSSKEEAQRLGSRLARRGTFLFDTRSKPDFGSLEDLPPGADVRLNDRRAEVVGGFTLGSGFSWNGMLMASEETFAEYSGIPPDRVTFGLVTLEPGTDVHEAQRQMNALLPSDARAYTREEISEHERRYWMQLTSVGQFLGVAVILAVVVGAIFVYQMMAADIRGMMPEYATVKALGYRPFYLTAIVLWQALLLAILGYLPGLVASFGMYYITRTVGGIPTQMTAERAVLVLVMTSGMCLASGLLAVRKVHGAEPADLF